MKKLPLIAVGEAEMVRMCSKNLLGAFNQITVDVQIINNVAAAIRVLNDSDVKLVLAGDGDFAGKLRPAVKKFLANGGTIICCAQFSSTIAPPTANAFFSSLGLPWKFGEYCRTNDQLSSTAAADFFTLTGSSDLPVGYSSKAVRLTNVAPCGRLYAPASGAKVQSFVFAATPVNNEEAQVAIGKALGGTLIYVGDVNGEVESAHVVRALCSEVWEKLRN